MFTFLAYHFLNVIQANIFNKIILCRQKRTRCYFSFSQFSKIIFPEIPFKNLQFDLVIMQVQLFIIFYGLPNIGFNIDAFPSAIIAFSLNIGAYASETIRGSILSIPKSQTEGAVACGLTIWQTMIHIVLPQAIKNCIPALFNSFISLVKDTSLAANITITEMFMATQRIVAVTYEPLALYIEVAAVYLLFSTGLTYFQKYTEKKLSKNSSVSPA